MIRPNPIPSPGPKGGRGRLAASALLLLAGMSLGGSIFLPIWRITLDAPQYPEGMGMLIWARTITGEHPHDLAIINELNHYIGMKTIVPDAIPELKLISPLILLFAALCVAAALRPRAWSLVLLLSTLAVAGGAGMVDFWMWEYDYGHNLNPMAAIKVPGMSYQPPLIGQAKLLNFLSTSWPASGGYLLFMAGALIAGALAVLWVRNRSPVVGRAIGASSLPALLAMALGVAGCGQSGPAPFHWGEDACHFCKMTLVQKGFAAQRINAKGKAYVFDSIECLLGDIGKRPLKEGERLFVSDWSHPEAPLLAAEKALFLKGGKVSSPMGGALAGFQAMDSATAYQARLGGNVLEWSQVQETL